MTSRKPNAEKSPHPWRPKERPWFPKTKPESRRVVVKRKQAARPSGLSAQARQILERTRRAMEGR